MPKFLNSQQAKKIDQLLMGDKYRFRLAQLMEMASLSCAGAARHYLVHEMKKKQATILALVGPGNNGGDCACAARHLKLFGFECDLWIPKEPKNEFYKDLIQQCRVMGIPLIEGGAEAVSDEKLRKYDLVLDGIFGFSFEGDIRDPYASIIDKVKKSNIPVFSIDVPSGWNVDEGNDTGKGFEAQALISLTAPKMCAKSFKGMHYLGGRFVPPSLAREFDLDLPEFEADSSWTIISRI
uniref:NAD(P)H-hydrate epimerase n=1 Tax=Percolomonas cosmopolitus TaxID=63605 RepID=A0A7S1PH22_9EUKA|mmetsp:Transcript_7367/g.27534  ORF Transcript_7367/g.27534 Transcript_7367/m.27534 type:complete len:238 (+) Transcript_7367:125-838(+)